MCLQYQPINHIVGVRMPKGGLYMSILGIKAHALNGESKRDPTARKGPVILSISGGIQLPGVFLNTELSTPVSRDSVSSDRRTT